MGSVDHGVAPFMLSFVQVTSRWDLMWVWVACGVSSQLSRGYGLLDPRTDSRLVEGVFPWIDEVSWTHGLLCGSTSPCGLVWVTSSPHDILCISLSSELQIRQMIYPF
jgi:hypothetical protein